jgi:hypothetical protein
MFGKVWMQIMEVTNKTKEELAKMEKEMIPFYILQFVLTIIFTLNLAGTYDIMLKGDPACSVYAAAAGLWFGIIVPIQISGIIWGNTKKKYWCKQIAVMTGMQFVGIMVAAFVLSSF